MLDPRPLAGIDPQPQLLLLAKSSSGGAVSIASVLRKEGYCVIGVADVDAAAAAISLSPPA